MRWPGVLFVAACMLAGGTILGNEIGRSHQAPVPPAKVVQVPKYIAGKDKIVEKNVVPQSCRDAIKAAQKMQAATDEYEKSAGKLPGLIDDAGVALATGDRAKLNDLREQQVKLEADSIQALLDLRDAQQRLDTAQPKCQADVH